MFGKQPTYTNNVYQARPNLLTQPRNYQTFLKITPSFTWINVILGLPNIESFLEGC